MNVLSDVSLTLAVFVAIIAVILALRTTIWRTFEIKNSDIMIALVPIALWLFMTDRIHALQVGDVKIERALKTPVAADVKRVDLPVDAVRASEKGAVTNIPRLISERTEALVFRLGASGYVGAAIEQYVRDLSKLPSFKYVIFDDRDGARRVRRWARVDLRDPLAARERGGDRPVDRIIGSPAPADLARLRSGEGRPQARHR